MSLQDRRKRAFSQAFLRINQNRLGSNQPQPAKRVSYHPPDNQENEAPPAFACTLEQTPGTQVRHQKPDKLQYAGPGIHTYAAVQYDLFSEDSKPEAGSNTDALPPPVVRRGHLGIPVSLDSPSTPAFVVGKSMFGPSPYVRSDVSPFKQAKAAVQTQPEEYLESDTPADPLTPNTLGFGDLSLNSHDCSRSTSPLRNEDQFYRTTVRKVMKSSFKSHFPEIHPNEVIILFDRGREIRKVDKYPLCDMSRFFANLLGDSFLEPTFTRCIRLRDDPPYAIRTMLHFIDSGNYIFDQQAFMQLPLLTTLDYHIHTYLVSTKYDIAALEELMVKKYIDFAEQEMTIGFLMLPEPQLADVHFNLPGVPVAAPADEYDSFETAITPLDRFLNSLVLLWRNTQSRYNAMRQAVLELIKHNLNRLLRVPFFVTLMQEVVGFGDDIVASLEDDGFEVKPFQAIAGWRKPRSVIFAP